MTVEVSQVLNETISPLRCFGECFLNLLDGIGLLLPGDRARFACDKDAPASLLSGDALHDDAPAQFSFCGDHYLVFGPGHLAQEIHGRDVEGLGHGLQSLERR